MDDLEKYIAKRKKKSRQFAGTFEVGYGNFKKSLINTDFIRIVKQIGILNYASHFETRREK
jgi:hypothetical protein